MWLEAVILTGYRSFRDRCEIRFDKGHTAIIGRNGSGKSNLLSALAFVLQAPKGLRMIEISHGSSNNLQQNVTVEVIINDDDGRLSGDVVEKDIHDPNRIVIKRCLGNKKDSFFIGRHSVTSKDVLELLSSAGVLTSNPYHFVRQGEINSLAEATPAQRLKLLEDFAGTTVHKEKRFESLKVYADAEKRIIEVRVQLEELEREITDLEEQDDKLKQFNLLSQKLRSIQFVILNNDLIKLNSDLKELKKTRNEYEKDSAVEKSRNELEFLETKLETLKKDATKSNNSEMRIRSELETLRKDLVSLTTDASKNDENIEELTQKIKEEEEKQKFAAAELDSVKIECSEARFMLERLSTKLTTKREKEEDCKKELARSHKRLDLIHGRLGKRAKFDNDHDYRAWLEEEIAIVGNQVENQKELISGLEGNRSEKKRAQEELLQKIARAKDDEVEFHEAQSSLAREREVLGRTCDRLKLERGHLHRENIALLQKFNHINEDLLTAEQRLARSRSLNNFISGVKSVGKILDYLEEKKMSGLSQEILSVLRMKGVTDELLVQISSQGLRREFLEELIEKGVENPTIDHIRKRCHEDYILAGIHGFVADNFEVPEHCYTAISATAGRQLLYLIVRDQFVVQEVLKLQKTLGLTGEIVFMALNLIKPYSGLVYPESKHYLPLIGCIKYEPMFEPIMEYVFGKIVIAQRMEHLRPPPPKSAAQEKSQRQLTFVTLDGQQATGKGVLTGGYYKREDSLMMLYLSYKKLKNLKVEAQVELDAKAHQLRELESALVKNLKSLENAKSRLAMNESTEVQKLMKLDQASAEIKILQGQQIELESSLRSQRIQLVEMEENLSSLNTMMDAGDSASLDDTQELQDLVSEIRDVKALGQKLSKESNSLEIKRNELKNNLEFCLELKLQELERDSSPEIVILTRDKLETLKERKEGFAQELKRIEKDIELANASLEEIIMDRTGQAEERENLEKDLEATKKAYEDLMNIRSSLDDRESLLRTKVNEVQLKIAEQGMLPLDWKSFESMPGKECDRIIKSIRKKLNKLGPLNQVSRYQLTDATEKRTQFLKRISELEKDHEAGAELMTVVNQRKQEKLELTRRQVSKYFSEIFSTLVPHGQGKLHFEMGIPQTPSTPSSSGDTSVSSISTPSSEASGPPARRRHQRHAEEEEKAIGLSVLVSFNNATELSDMKMLSGGQKTIVAIAFIFAIQKCDPAPFYIFDEVDAALDAGARRRVADWMEKSKLDYGTQFITTTHRKELLEKADKFIGVKHSSTESQACEVSREQAVEFITI